MGATRVNLRRGGAGRTKQAVVVDAAALGRAKRGPSTTDLPGSTNRRPGSPFARAAQKPREGKKRGTPLRMTALASRVNSGATQRLKPSPSGAEQAEQAYSKQKHEKR